MPAGGEGALTLTVRMKVSPEPESEQTVLDLLRRYRDALNYSIRVIIANKALSLGKAHKLLYKELQRAKGEVRPIIYYCRGLLQGCHRYSQVVAQEFKKGQGAHGEEP